jgi:oligosaccharide repeat unit polymerase
VPHSSRRKSWRALLIWSQVGVVGAVLGAWLLLNQGACGPGVIVEIGCIALPLELAWIVHSWRSMGHEMFSPYGLFVGSVFVFNAGQACLQPFGLNRNGLLGGRISENVLAETVLLVLYAFSAMHFGALIAVATGGRHQVRPAPTAAPSALRRVAILLFVVSVFGGYVMWGRALSVVAEGGYAALYQAQGSTGFGASAAILSGFLMPSAFLLLAGSRFRRPSRACACAFVGCYIALQLLVGFRGNAAVVLAAFLWLWHRSIRRLPVAVPVALLAAVAVFVLPVVGTTRRMAGMERLSLAQWRTAYAALDNPVVEIVSEMGGSMVAPAYTIQFVPSIHDYELGRSYAYAALSLVPNLFWTVHPAAAHSPSKWLVDTADPSAAQAGGGLGFSVIAEAYLNFGFLGAGVPMALLGWAVARLSRWTEGQRSPLNVCVVAIALVPLLIYGRAEAGNVMRGVAWFAAIPYFMVKYWPTRRSKRACAPQLRQTALGELESRMGPAASVRPVLAPGQLLF